MPTLAIDIETFSRIDIADAGVYRYAKRLILQFCYSPMRLMMSRYR